MTRIDKRFAALKREGRAGLVTFITAGDPDYDTSLAILKDLPAAGADIIELGMPFSDPMADGPAIQASSQRALKAGQIMKKTLSLVKAFRAGDNATPLVLMGYYNPIYVYPVDRFIADTVAAGADGLIVVDMPPEEDAELRPAATAAGLNFIRLATPTTDAKRLPAVLANTSGFVYYVYGRFNVVVPLSTAGLGKAGHPISRDDVAAADLAIFKISGDYHVGIMMNRLEFIHASKSRGVVVDRIDAPYWRRNFTHFRRVL